MTSMRVVAIAALSLCLVSISVRPEASETPRAATSSRAETSASVAQRIDAKLEELSCGVDWGFEPANVHPFDFPAPMADFAEQFVIALE